MNYQETMQAKRTLENELRSRSYIHDLVDKESTAQFFGLPIKTFYHTPLNEWVHQSKRFYEMLNCMSRDIAPVSEWAGVDLRPVPFSEWVPLYRQWLTEQC